MLFRKISSFFLRRKRRKAWEDWSSLRHSEDDLLSAEDKAEFDRLLTELRAAPDEEIPAALKSFPQRVNRLKTLPKFGFARNTLDLLAVIGAVAFGLRGLYFQPFSIPTSSMQPTLYGIHYRTPEKELATPLPNVVKSALFSTRRARWQVVGDGEIDDSGLYPLNTFLDTTGFRVGNHDYQLPGTPDKVFEYANIQANHVYRAGETPVDGYLSLGDHLFVERFSLYFSEPKRGDIMVFNTENLAYNGHPLALQSGYYYVKRLVGLPGDTIKIVDNQVFLKPKGAAIFRKIQDFDKRFEKIYSGQGGYHGHLSECNGEYAVNQEIIVPEDCYFMLGDNSKFSLDGRYFGFVPRKNLVGKAFLVFWPFSRRWGIVDHIAPLPEPTGSDRNGTFPVMYKQ